MTAEKGYLPELLPDSWERRSGLDGSGVVSVGDVVRSDEERHLALEIVTGVDGAAGVVFVVTFLLSDAAIIASLERAARRGVRVYLLLSAEARLEDAVRDGEFDRRVYDEHLAMLRRLAGWCCVRSARGFHAKAVLVDPTLPAGRTKRGWLLTANLGKEPLERNEELGVRLSDAELAHVWHHGVRAFWALAEHEFLSPVRDAGAPSGLPVRADGRFVPSSTLGSILATTPDRQLRAEVGALIAGAQRRIVVACFGFDPDDAIIAALCTKAIEMDVVVLARKRPAAEPALLLLARAGARVFGFDHLHAKAVLVDDARGLVMTANLEAHGLDQGFELGVRLGAERSRGLFELLSQWERRAPWVLRLSSRMEDVTGELVPVSPPKKKAGAQR